MIKTEVKFNYERKFCGKIYKKVFSNTAELSAMVQTHYLIASIAKEAIKYDCTTRVCVKRNNEPLYTCIIVPDNENTEFMFYNSVGVLTVTRTIKTKKLYNRR